MFKFLPYLNKTGAEIVHLFLQSKNIKVVSGFSGGAVLPILNEFCKSNKIKFITTAHEQGAGHMMESYGRFRECGVVITTSGPGVTNLITPLYNAYSDSNSLIVITGQVHTKSLNTDAFQECPAIKLTKHCTKWNHQLKSINELPYVLEKAYNIATGRVDNRCGPVHIDIPKDLQLSILDSVNFTMYKCQHNLLLLKKSTTVKYSKNGLENVINLIETKPKVIFFVGKGGLDCQDMITHCVFNLGIPVTTSLHGLGSISEYNSYALKMVGMHGSYTANMAISEASVIIGLGVRFDDRTIGTAESYGQNATVVHIDIDKKRLVKVRHIIKNKYSLHMSVKSFLKKLSGVKVIPNVLRVRREWVTDLQKLNYAVPFYIPPTNQLYIQHVLIKLNKLLSNKSYIFTTGVGNHQMMTAQFITWTPERKLITSGSLGVMGSGLPFAMGAALAKPKSTIICIDGDGSFNMSLNELKTMIQYNIPVKIFLMNDNRQQMVYVWQKLFCNENYIATTNTNPDYTALGESYKLKTYECSSNSNCTEILKSALEYNGPVLVHFKVTPSICTPLVVPGKSLNTMILHNSSTDNIDSQYVPS